MIVGTLMTPSMPWKDEWVAEGCATVFVVALWFLR